MNPFHQKHSDKITGTLSSFDRVLFKGHLRQIAFGGGIEKLLARQGYLIKDFQRVAKDLSNEVDEAAKSTAEELGRPCLYLSSCRTRKESLIEKIIKEDGIEEGLVAVLRVVEGAQSFRVASGKGRPKIANASRKCLCVYYYFLDPRFGLVHLRIQTWLPFTVQVCVNGHEYLRRRLDAEGTGYAMMENSFHQIDDWDRAQELANEFAALDWPLILGEWAKKANPHLDVRQTRSGPAGGDGDQPTLRIQSSQERQTQWRNRDRMVPSVQRSRVLVSIRGGGALRQPSLPGGSECSG
jgi:hypothetical protein